MQCTEPHSLAAPYETSTGETKFKKKPGIYSGILYKIIKCPIIHYSLRLKQRL